MLLIAKAQMALELYEEAELSLNEARRAAEHTGSRRHLWKIKYYLGHCALRRGNQDEADDLFRQAKETLSYIFDHIPNEELRASFMARHEVELVLETQKEDYLFAGVNSGS